MSVGCSSGLEFHGRATGRLALVKKLGLTRFLDSAVLFLPSANPKVACYGTISTPTRRAPAATDPRLFAVGDSHRSQGFLYPWKPYAPPHIPVYSRFVPPPQAAEQTGKRPKQSEHPRCLCRLRRQRHRGNGIWRGHESLRNPKSPQPQLFDSPGRASRPVAFSRIGWAVLAKHAPILFPRAKRNRTTSHSCNNAWLQESAGTPQGLLAA